MNNAVHSIESEIVGNKSIKLTGRCINSALTYAKPSLSGGKNNVPIQLLNEIKLLPILTVGHLSAFVGCGIMIKLGKRGRKDTMTINQSVATSAKHNISSQVLKPAEIGWTY